MAPKTKMAQATLSFTAAKRTASTNIAGKPKASATTTKAAPVKKQEPTVGTDDEDKDVDLREGTSDAESSDADSDQEVSPSANTKTQTRSTRNKAAEAITPSASTRPVTRSSTAKSPAKASQPIVEPEEADVSTPKSAKPKASVFGQTTGNATPENVAKKVKENLASAPSVEAVSEPAELDPKSPRWRRAARDAKTKRGGVAAIHAEDQNQVHDILRVFDNNYDFGPCVGISRLDRWNRAKKLGLNPPPEVEEILKTKQGIEDAEYSQTVFYGKV